MQQAPAPRRMSPSPGAALSVIALLTALLIPCGSAAQDPALYGGLRYRNIGLAQLDYLYEIIGTADFLPSREAFDRFAEPHAALDEYLAALRRMVTDG